MHNTLPSSHQAMLLARAWLVLSFFALPAAGADDVKPGTHGKPYNPIVASASDQAEKAIRTFRVPAGLKIELFAAEPLLANPVAFCIDEKGRIYVAETFRHGAGVTDTRGHMNWLDDDLASRTVADRVTMYKKFFGAGFESYKVEHERVRQVVDRDGDGKADTATVFADGFNDPAAGIGAGLLARKGEVWYTCIPWLWKLRDAKGQGTATERTLLHEGYGVHVGFLGHDLHGLRMGPDGRLYFSIGDRGFNVTTREGRKLAVQDTGSVLRCNPDGTDLEVFATGLRNPQELAFDQYGNLFTGDNNSDSGDKARWVYLVEGGDSGWRIGYQFMEDPYSRGPWNEEKLWDPAQAAKAAYLVPPVANLADGPSGLTYNPGVSLLPDRYKDHFFLVDFRGSSGQSGIRGFAVKPKGASFELVDAHQFVWNTLATDADFGPDGALYFSDWVEGWEKPNKGRIYRVLDPARRNDRAVQEVKLLLAEGMEKHSIQDLATLLTHADMRVRQEAQFELARRATAGGSPSHKEAPADLPQAILGRVAATGANTLARIHAIWGLEQIARASSKSAASCLWPALEPLLADGDPEVRAQTAKVLGDSREFSALNKLVGLLKDQSPRVRFFAALALGKLARHEAFEPLLDLLRGNADKDAYLRHAAVMGLVGVNDKSALQRAATDPSSSVRMGALLAMRRLADPAVADFLNDREPSLVLEAARAINDVPIAAAIPKLAAVRLTSESPAPLLRRVANANFRLGEAQSARILAELAARSDLGTSIRTQALAILGEWASPSGRDKVMGLWRPIAPRSAQPAAQALQPKLKALFGDKSGTIRQAAIRAASSLEMKEAGPKLVSIVLDKSSFDGTRAEALKGLARIHAPERLELARKALELDGSRSHVEALRILVEADAVAAREAVDRLLEKGTPFERQGTFSILADSPDSSADQALLPWLDRLIAGQVPPEIQLDLIEAAARRPSREVHAKLEKYESSKPKNDPSSPYRETLVGGNAGRGRQVFLTKAEVSCLRCHKYATFGGRAVGGEVGPDLTGVGSRQTREYLLESIVSPDQKIAQGFESVVLATSDGKVVTGVLKGEDGKEIRLMTAEGETITVPKDEVEDRKRGPSAMPADLVTKLSKSEIRDLIEFLARLKGK
jgi:quinoprotein glucose dehydrogenase